MSSRSDIQLHSLCRCHYCLPHTIISALFDVHAKSTRKTAILDQYTKLKRTYRMEIEIIFANLLVSGEW